MVLAKHGVSGEYLQKLGIEMTNSCHNCVESEDAGHDTLYFRPTWEAARRILRLALGARLVASCFTPTTLFDNAVNTLQQCWQH
jgi:hypothetical protein